MKVGRIVAVALALAHCLPAMAQYKWISPDGSVTYGDRPPAGASKVLVDPARRAVSPPSDNAELPYAVRGAVARYPVTLYTAPGCEPCTLLRDHLSKRGIPFSERVVKSAADAKALEKLGLSGNLMPSLTVGRQQTSGYEPASVDSLLDAAGYPKRSVLTRGWRPPSRDLAGDEAGDASAMTAAPESAGNTAGSGPRTVADDGRRGSDARASGNRLVMPESPKPVTAAPPLPARIVDNPDGVRF